MTRSNHHNEDKLKGSTSTEIDNKSNSKANYVFYQFNNIDKRYTFASPAIEELTGYTLDELNELGLKAITREKILVHGNGYSSHRSTAVEKIKESFATYLIQTKEGKLKWIEDNSFTYLDKAGEASFITGILQDVSASMKAEKVKQIVLEILDEANSEKNLNELFKFIHSSIRKLMKADNFYIAYYRREQDILTFPYFVDEIDNDSSSKKFGRGLTEYVIQKGKSALIDFNLDEELINKDEVELRGPQSQVWLGVPLKIKDKTIGAMVVQDYNDPYTYDLSDKDLFDMIAFPISRAIERKIVEEEKEGMIKQLKEMNRSKDRLFSLISHDLKSPFNSLLGFANILTNEYDSLTQRDIKEYLNVINDSSQTLFGMTTNLLHYSSLQLGKYELRPKDLSISAEVNYAYLQLKDRIDKKNLLFTTNINESTTLFADKDMFNLILTNIISNSIKYTAKDGNINVKAEVVNSVNKISPEVTITITDNGEGIKKETLKKINNNEKFSTLGTNKEQGTGLGILLVKEALAKTNGTLLIESESGNGTVVVLRFPAGSSAYENHNIQKTNKV